MYKNSLIYFDNAATTPLSPTALSAMKPWLTSEYGNPSSLYRAGRKAKEALECARAMIARTINAEPDEIFFTSGGTEADNWAIDMIGTHGDIITSSIEHHAILNAAHNRFERDVKALKLMTDCHGHIVPPNESETRSLILQNKPAMCSFMFVNNEIGTIQDLRKLFKIYDGYGLIYHTDAVQAVGHIPVDVKKLGIDMLSMSAHKFNGPRGIGALYVRNGVPMYPMICGGGQERKMRAGTENVAGAVGMAVALDEAVRFMDERMAHTDSLKHRFVDACTKNNIRFATTLDDPFSNNTGILSMRFPEVEAESLLLLLDSFGICVSTGSACDSKSVNISHVLSAIGLSDTDARSTIRFSFGHQNTFEEVDYAVDSLAKCIDMIRSVNTV